MPSSGGRTRDRVAAAFVVLATPIVLLALLDPLEGGIVIGLLAIPLAGAGSVLRSRARWLVLGGLALLAVTFALMATVAQDVAVLENAVLAPWLGAVLFVVAGDVLLLRRVVGVRRPAAANGLAAGLALVAVALMLRVAVALGDYRPWDVPMSARASVNGPGVRLVLLLEDSAFTTDAALWSAATFENTGGGPVTLAPGTLLDVIVRDAGGEVVWDGAERYYGPVPKSMPWDAPIVVAPGTSTRRIWMLGCEATGTYRVTARVQGGPFDGLVTEPVIVTCSAPGSP